MKNDNKPSEDKEVDPPKENEEEAIQDAGPLNARMIYEVVRRNGEDELRRPDQSLFWSGIAAGLLISFSVLGEAIFQLWVSPGDPRADAAFHREHDHHGSAAGEAPDDARDRGDVAALGDRAVGQRDRRRGGGGVHRLFGGIWRSAARHGA